MILLADSGSTKTDWRLIRPDGSQQQLLTDGINPYYETAPAIAAILAEQLRPHLPNDAVDSVYFYGSGCTGPGPNELVKTALKTSLLVSGTISVASDLLGAARATCGHNPGVVAILGTGSNISAYDGRDLTSPGLSLGFWLGDEGSGGHLGKTLVRAFLLDQLPPELSTAFATDHPQVNRLTVLDRAYRQPFPNRYFASFAPFLARHLAHPFVQVLVQDSFRQFVLCYALRLPETRTSPLHCVGSVAEHFAPILHQTLLEAGCQPGQIVSAPADGLVRYHTHQ